MIYLLGHMRDQENNLKAIVKLDNLAFDENILKELMSIKENTNNNEDVVHPIISENHFF